MRSEPLKDRCLLSFLMDEPHTIEDERCWTAANAFLSTGRISEDDEAQRGSFPPAPHMSPDSCFEWQHFYGSLSLSFPHPAVSPIELAMMRKVKAPNESPQRRNRFFSLSNNTTPPYGTFASMAPRHAARRRLLVLACQTKKKHQVRCLSESFA